MPIQLPLRLLILMIQLLLSQRLSNLFRRNDGGRHRLAVTLVLSLAAALMLIGCSSTNADEAPRDDEGSLVGVGEVGINRLRLGDCFDQGSDVVSSTSVEAVQAVPCDEAHDQEVFYLGALPEDDYPGDQVTADLVAEQCIAVFETYVGSSYAESELDIAYIYPSQDSWGDGDRGYVCSLFDVTLESLEGSMRGAAR